MQELKILFEKERMKAEKLEKDVLAQQAKLREYIDRGMRMQLILFDFWLIFRNCAIR